MAYIILFTKLWWPAWVAATALMALICKFANK